MCSFIEWQKLMIMKICGVGVFMCDLHGLFEMQWGVVLDSAKRSDFDELLIPISTWYRINASECWDSHEDELPPWMPRVYNGSMDILTQPKLGALFSADWGISGSLKCLGCDIHSSMLLIRVLMWSQEQYNFHPQFSWWWIFYMTSGKQIAINTCQVNTCTHVTQICECFGDTFLVLTLFPRPQRHSTVFNYSFLYHDEFMTWQVWNTSDIYIGSEEKPIAINIPVKLTPVNPLITGNSLFIDTNRWDR